LIFLLRDLSNKIYGLIIKWCFIREAETTVENSSKNIFLAQLKAPHEASMNEFIFPIKVYIEDTDFGGVVYHSNYLKYYERARSEWLESLGLGIDWQMAQKLYFPVRAANLEYLKPARLNAKLEVITRIESMRPTSIVFHQYLRPSQTTDTILSKASITIVCVNPQFRPQALPHCQLHEIITGDQA
jgi:tol-pal system-associated acyl-CoA thioesterase